MSLNPYSAGAYGYAAGEALRSQGAADRFLVLLVKDHEENTCEMKQVLELNGYRVVESDNGQDASKRARYAIQTSY